MSSTFRRLQILKSSSVLLQNEIYPGNYSGSFYLKLQDFDNFYCPVITNSILYMVTSVCNMWSKWAFSVAL